jgi:hypothetical protein
MENFDPFFLFQDNDIRGIKGTLSDSNPLAKIIRGDLMTQISIDYSLSTSASATI